MDELISRQDAIDVLEILSDKMSDEGKTVMAQAVAVLNDLQSAEPERKRGEWIEKKDPYEFFDSIPVCSECGCTNTMRERYNFCPNCGADMRGE